MQVWSCAICSSMVDSVRVGLAFCKAENQAFGRELPRQSTDLPACYKVAPGVASGVDDREINLVSLPGNSEVYTYAATSRVYARGKTALARCNAPVASSSEP